MQAMGSIKMSPVKRVFVGTVNYGFVHVKKKHLNTFIHRRKKNAEKRRIFFVYMYSKTKIHRNTRPN